MKSYECFRYKEQQKFEDGFEDFKRTLRLEAEIKV